MSKNSLKIFVQKEIDTTARCGKLYLLGTLLIHRLRATGKGVRPGCGQAEAEG
jgi:hypothetical protein